jgi:hypothetical protein
MDAHFIRELESRLAKKNGQETSSLTFDHRVFSDTNLSCYDVTITSSVEHESIGLQRYVLSFEFVGVPEYCDEVRLTPTVFFHCRDVVSKIQEYLDKSMYTTHECGKLIRTNSPEAGFTELAKAFFATPKLPVSQLDFSGVIEASLNNYKHGSTGIYNLPQTVLRGTGLHNHRVSIGKHKTIEGGIVYSYVVNEDGNTPRRPNISCGNIKSLEHVRAKLMSEIMASNSLVTGDELFSGDAYDRLRETNVARSYFGVH